MLIMVVDGYEPLVDDISNEVERRMTNEKKRKIISIFIHLEPLC